jgi:cytidyltransferase-like protein
VQKVGIKGSEKMVFLFRKRVVYIPGVWDLLHVGHLRALKRASELGHKLIVGVQSDRLVEEQKGVPPAVNEELRASALKCLPFVDDVYIYDDFDYAKHLKICGANILALNELYKNEPRFSSAIEYLSSIGGKFFYLPYTREISDTEIKKKIVECANPWQHIWMRIGSQEDKDDYEIIGSDKNKVQLAAQLVKEIFKLDKATRYGRKKILDFGCGTGLTLKEMPDTLFKYGVDISPGLLQRARKNNPKATLVLSDRIPFRNEFEYIYSVGVFQYFPNRQHALEVLFQMLEIGKNILILGVPDLEKKEMREERRRALGLRSTPEHMYYSKKDFEELGFKVWDNDVPFSRCWNFEFNAFFRK